MANLELDPDPGMHGAWGSGADAWFEWSREGAPKVRFGLLSGVGAVRWHADGWHGDAQLTEKGHAFLLDWLAERGVDQPKRVLEFDRRRRQTKD